MRNRRGIWLGIVAAVVLAVAVCALGVAASWLYISREEPVPAGGDRIIALDEPRPLGEAREVSLLDAESAIVEAIEGTKPAVVSISTSQTVSIPGYRPPFAEDPFFRRFFGQDWIVPPREGVTTGLGSGVIVDPSGVILTNYHVVGDADDIEVRLADGREFDGEILGSDERTDIAVVRIQSDEDLPYALLGNSNDLRVGQFSIAIGTPFDERLSQTVTLGIVSAIGRSGLGIEDFEDFIQTDAAINPGNSGGPLINLSGEVIGINTAITTSGGRGNQGIGFAVPVNLARHVMRSILEHGRVIRGYLGVTIQDLTPELAESMGLSVSRGAVVTEVLEGGPAALAGIERGDVITAWNGRDVTSASGLTAAVTATEAASTASIDLLRDGEAITLPVEVGERPEDLETASAGGKTGEGEALEDLGISVREVSGDEAEAADLPSDGALLVTNVESGSIADEAGIALGAGIIEAGGERTRTVEDLEAAATDEAIERGLRLLVRQRGGNIFIVLRSRD